MSATKLPRNTNQALGIGQYAIDFMQSGDPAAVVQSRTILFHTDSVLCGASALALGTNALVPSASADAPQRTLSV